MEQEDKERIEEIEEEITELEARKEEVNNDYDSYDEMIDDLGDVNIGSLSYSASHVLKNIDEIAYNCGFSDYIDEELSNIEGEIDDLNDELKELLKWT